eukprot:scaffold3437_cov113-Cylindrotheca_fusiformis.AAC.34
MAPNKTKATSNSQESLCFQSLPQEVTLHTLEFLDVDSICQVARTCHEFRDALSSEDAVELWLSQSRNKWGDYVTRNTRLVNKLKISKALGEKEINLPVLLFLTPSHLPSEVDRSRNFVASDLIQVSNEDCSLQYKGEVGSEVVHSIRSDNPLPRPSLRKPKKKFSALCKQKSKWNPFVAPFVEKDQSMNVTPRVVSYFEVSIAKPALAEERPRSSVDAAEAEPQDCIAIGIATDMFDCKGVLPGHDYSFAYHSDNGGLYHGTGGKHRRANRYGPGDVVGCGVDYSKGAIFFTRNSKLLGYGWEDLNLNFLANTDLYPVVGLDSANPISVNYGHKPFEFDLSEYCREHSKTLSAQFRI